MFSALLSYLALDPTELTGSCLVGSRASLDTCKCGRVSPQPSKMSFSWYHCSQETWEVISDLLGERGLGAEQIGLGEAQGTHPHHYCATVVMGAVLSAGPEHALLWPGGDAHWQAPPCSPHPDALRAHAGSWAAVQKPRAFLRMSLPLRPRSGYFH